MDKIKKYTIIFIAINLLILGVDKFFQFIPLSCTLMIDASKSLMYGLGVIEVGLGILLLLGKFTKFILIGVCLLMVWAIVMHLVSETYDIGGAVFLAILSIVPLLLPNTKVGA